jgi:hypothetical protein
MPPALFALVISGDTVSFFLFAKVGLDCDPSVLCFPMPLGNRHVAMPSFFPLGLGRGRGLQICLLELV